jgi:maltose-binding protein MalE
MKKLTLHPNLFAIILLTGSFFVSIWIVMKQTGTLDQVAGREQRVVRFLHWQLEPGFREALQAVIDEYNELPQVREAGYMVEQIAISEKFYPQFLNVHLISGTSPDLVTRGKATLTSRLDQFFEPLGQYVEQPNPYNTEETVDAGLPDDIRQRLIHGPWQDTFIDNLQSGYDEHLRNYYAIPVSNWGPLRLYYNVGLIREAKDLLLERLADSANRPQWLLDRLVPAGGSFAEGYLFEDQQLYDWLNSDRPPDTLGRLLLTSDAIWELARVENRPFLVPIAGSSYTRETFATLYAPTFQYDIFKDLDLDLDSSVSQYETFGTWAKGDWGFDNRQIEAYFETLQEVAKQFPRGFLGLDREQANRRFIMQNAAMLLTGAWDASSIFTLAEQQANAFEVGVTPLPVPGANERFGDFANLPPSESAQGLGVPMMLYKLSSVKEEAIDFLQYLTSYQGNSEFTQLSGWLPATIGVDPSERMRPFLPVHDGVSSLLRLNITGGNVGTVLRGQMFLYIGGDIDYPTFKSNVVAAMEDERMGVNRLWHEQFIRDGQADRNTQMSLSTQAILYLSGTAPESQERYQSILQRSLTLGNGHLTMVLWHQLFPDEPLPQF